MRAHFLIVWFALAGCSGKQKDSELNAGPAQLAADGGMLDGGCRTFPVPVPQLIPEVAQVTTQCGSNGSPPALVGPVPAATVFSMAVGLTIDEQGLADFAAQVSDPSSPYYRQYLTGEQIADRFGPSQCDYDALTAWLTAQGFSVSTYASRISTDVSGSVGVYEAAFHVTFNYYLRPNGTQFYAPNTDPSLDFDRSLLGISGLDNCFVSTPI